MPRRNPSSFWRRVHLLKEERFPFPLAVSLSFRPPPAILHKGTFLLVYYGDIITDFYMAQCGDLTKNTAGYIILKHYVY
jgi:hypothetical protein